MDFNFGVFFCSGLQRQIEMSHNTKLNVFLLLKVSRDRMDSLISNEQTPQKKWTINSGCGQR